MTQYEAAAPTSVSRVWNAPAEPRESARSWRTALFIFGVALLLRLALLPFATFDAGDSASRIWIAWDWMEHPRLILAGEWGPLHFYMMGALLRLWPDPVWAPAVLHAIVGALIAPVVYELAFAMFRAPRSAVLTGLAFAVYPAAVASSLFAISEPPFMLFLALGLLFLVRAQQAPDSVREPVLAGIAIGLASMLRFEAWMLLPFLALPLLRRPRQLLAFLAPALVHPVIWTIGSAVIYHDPLYSFTWGSYWERTAMGNAPRVSLAWSAGQVWYFLRSVASGLSPPLLLLTAAGVMACLWQWRRQASAIWLIPPAALLAQWIGAAAIGSLVVKWEYTPTFGLMFIPFCACALQKWGVEQWSTREFVWALVGLPAAICLFAVDPLWRVVPHGQAVAAHMIPSFPDMDRARRVLALINLGRPPEHSALVSDFYGWQPTYYVALHTKLPPEEIYTANGAPNEPMPLSKLDSFLRLHPDGVLLTRDGGRLSSLLRSDGDRTLKVGATTLHVDSVGAVDWGPIGTLLPGAVHVLRYHADEGTSSGPLAASDHATTLPAAAQIQANKSQPR
jgi:hypothetical protein